MAVSTKQVKDRREVSYATYDELAADAREMASSNVKCVGNWTLAQIMGHLQGSFVGCIDGGLGKAPFFIRLMAPLLMKNMLIHKKVPAGFRFGKTSEARLKPNPDVSTEDALAGLQQAIDRCKTEPSRIRHPALGNISREEWDNFNLRHAELHMSFVKPVDGAE
ncbi:MAG: DUF1569 domain-containing protein [Planctomycetota bacterium]|nr:DUF1569 domain-containing protein [Planctomycetota bacterium]